MISLIDKLQRERTLSESEFVSLINCHDKDVSEELCHRARQVRETHYGRDIYVRGLIEFTNYCRCDCLYCGIRRSNKNAERYRLTEDDIMECCREGHAIGYRTFVLQGGEDLHYTPEAIAAIVKRIKSEFPDAAVTLSFGEHPLSSYELWRAAGADRYLLRHETADADHFARLHPRGQTLDKRLRCLYDLKSLGYQVGCGFMVGSPTQTTECLAKDLRFIAEFGPDMVGIGPFIPHGDTPFGGESRGDLDLTLRLLSMVRLIIPDVLLPATTALASIHPEGRELGILAGANVCMPNLSPSDVRAKYSLYDGKLHSGSEAAASRRELEARMEKIGYRIVTARGDRKGKYPEDDN